MQDLRTQTPERTQRDMLTAGKQNQRLDPDNYDFDDELVDLIDEACADLHVIGIRGESATIDDPPIRKAVKLYVKLNFGAPDPQEKDRLSRSYEDIKGQIWASTGYTVWPHEQEGEADGS